MPHPTNGTTPEPLRDRKELPHHQKKAKTSEVGTEKRYCTHKRKQRGQQPFERRRLLRVCSCAVHAEVHFDSV